MLKKVETYDERCSRVDAELRATEVRWPIGYTIIGVIIVVSVFWAAVVIFSRVV
jgi:hypothetical protein